MSELETIDISDSEEEDEVMKDFRTVNSRFQERLLAAQHDALEKQVESKVENPEQQDDNTSSIGSEIQRLEQLIQKTQLEVTDLEKELDDWRHKREAEAMTSSLTAEERARRVEQEQDTTSDDAQATDRLVITLADVDSIFDYLFELGSAPPPDTAAELDNTTGFGEPNRSMKDKIFEHPDIIEQRKFTHMTFTKMDNKFVDLGHGEYRECALTGTAYDTPFSVSFRVSPTLEVCDLDFEVPLDFQVDGKTLLSKIKQENNLHLFFRLIQHYGCLEFDKQRTFTYLMDYYKGTDVRVIKEDASCLQFDTEWVNFQLNLTWVYKSTENILYEKLDVNICEQFMPRVRLAVISEWRSTQFELVMSEVPERFEALATTHGVLSATKIMVGMILLEPFEDKQTSR